MTSRVKIIAEAGVNHNGNIDRACAMVKAAAEAGADYVKFQTFRPQALVTAVAAKANYQAEATGSDETQLQMLRALELDAKSYSTLIAACERFGIGFSSTGFDEQSVDLLISLKVDFLKIPSGEITNLPLLRHIGSQSKPVILSTGMASMEEIRAALHEMENAGTPRNEITVLHCNTEYPTPMEDVNLRAMQTIGETFAVAVGYSDHTLGIEVPIAAVAMGATVIEKHFTLDRNLPGPDHKASLEPEELKAMVAAIRNIEEALGDGVKRPSPSEAKNIAVARKSLVAARAIHKDEIFTPENLAAKRPGTGISPMRWDEVLGEPAKRDFEVDEMIEL